jgi:transposase InsO family protein
MATDRCPSIPTASFSTTPPYQLRNSVILDSAATTHIFNAMHWFEGNIEPTNTTCYAGKGAEPITGFGTAKISLESANGIHYALLSNSAYIPGFNVNIISLRKLNAKGVFWNNEQNFLYSLDYGREVIWAKLEEKAGQNVIQFREPGDIPTEMDVSAYITQPRIERPPARGAYSARPIHLQPSVTALGLLWHRRLGHAGPKAIQKLTAAVLPDAHGDAHGDAHRDVKLLGPAIHECEQCAISKITQRISRMSPTRPATRPFERLHFDMIFEEPGFNDNTKCLHLWCEYTKYHVTRNINTPSELSQALIEEVTRLETRFPSVTVRFLKTDGERTLGSRDNYPFRVWIRKRGITLEQSTPGNYTQNGGAERAGGLLILKARCLCAQSNLPGNLWPLLYNTAAYLLNRMPTESIGWKTPWIAVQEDLGITPVDPSIAHLRVFCCRAYTLKKHLPKVPKTTPRAHIGYLAGYESTNIYLIWVPSLEKVIRIRDVIFDEEKFYSQTEMDLAAELQVPIEQLVRTLDYGEQEREQLRELRTYNDDSDDELLDTIIVRPRPLPQQQSTESDREQSFTPSTIDSSASTDPSTTTSSSTPTDPSTATDSSTSTYTSSRPIRNRKAAKPRAALHTAVVEHEVYDDAMPALHSAFAAALALQATYTAGPINAPAGPHRDSLPEAPRNWKQLQDHPERSGFLAAAQSELDDLVSRGAFTAVEKSPDLKPYTVPTTWVFTYKFDENGHLVRYKARLCVRGDLQKATGEDTYAATLAG